ncbi:MAG: hypothetical protein ACTSRP_16280 [Candidatus Helarchaeota archaeon]
MGIDSKLHDLIEEIAENFNQYLMNKTISVKSFYNKIDPDLNIEDLQRLLRIHFILTEKNETVKYGVIDFIRNLPIRLRRIKKTIKKNPKISYNEVKGKINWSKTLKIRMNRCDINKSLFICEIIEKDYDIPENLVLKEILSIIYSIIEKDIKKLIENRPDWLEKWINKEKLISLLKQIYQKNVYLKRINIRKKISFRVIERIKRSRNLLYKEAAHLLSQYYKLMNFEVEPHEAKELLKNTFIIPKKEDVLFELYWTIKIIKNLQQQYKTKFFIIEPGSGIVARCEDENFEYQIFHDSIGIFRFFEPFPQDDKKIEINNNYFKRIIKVIEKYNEIIDIKEKVLWKGRPDIIVLKKSKYNQNFSVLIGEVKYTQNKNYALTGLKQLLEYIALIRDNCGNYINDYENLFTDFNKVKGCLFTADIKNLEFHNEFGIHLIKYQKNKITEIDDKLEKILNHL